MRTTIRLPDSLLRRAKRKAAARGQTLTALIAESLEAVLVEAKERPPRAPIPLSTAVGGLYPGVDHNDSAALLDRMEGR
jgi:hypothetical protein